MVGNENLRKGMDGPNANGDSGPLFPTLLWVGISQRKPKEMQGRQGKPEEMHGWAKRERRLWARISDPPMSSQFTTSNTGDARHAIKT